jgi:hypothetical protein
MADYYLAEQKGWMLYLEGSTDLAILRCLADRLKHPAGRYLSDSVPVIYLGTNLPQEARNHFQGLREAKPNLVALALFDRVDKELHTGSQLLERMWSQREIENYLVTPESLRAFVMADLIEDDLIARAERNNRLAILDPCIVEITNALRLTGEPDPWGSDIKVTDRFLDPLFKLFFERLGTPQRTFKRDYHGLAAAIPIHQLDPEIHSMLDLIAETASRAMPSI